MKNHLLQLQHLLIAVVLLQLQHLLIAVVLLQLQHLLIAAVLLQLPLLQRVILVVVAGEIEKPGRARVARVASQGEPTDANLAVNIRRII
jgi:hypothetical protein